MRFEFALIVLAALLSVSQPVTAQEVDQRPSVLVNGRGEVESKPDRATFRYRSRGEGPTSDEAVRAMVAMGASIEAALRSIDPKAQIRTTDVASVPIRPSACRGDEDYDASEQLSKGVCAIEGYVAKQQITVETSRLNDVGTMGGLAARGGAENASIGGFSLSASAKAQAYQRALSGAFRDAANNAQQLAAGGGLKLGPILTASNVSPASPPAAYETDAELITLSAERAGPPPVKVKLEPVLVTTSASVAVRYEIVN